MGDVDEGPRIMGSPRKGNTYRAAERIRELMEVHGPVEFEYLWLRDANLLPCLGCFARIDNYPEKDDAPAVEQTMCEAAGVVETTHGFIQAPHGLPRSDSAALPRPR
jgi:multimeric flavodoxin WrbA